MFNIYNCLCGHGENCYNCSSLISKEDLNKDQQIKDLQYLLQRIYDVAEDTMGTPGVPGSALLNMKWICKLAARGLGKED